MGRGWYEALALVPAAPDVHADETSIRQLGLDNRAFIWDFVTKALVVYRYATSRSGETPKKVLGDSQGRLVVDAYTGYNAVTTPGKRTRGGCLAHARRKIFEQREHVEAKEALDRPSRDRAAIRACTSIEPSATTRSPPSSKRVPSPRSSSIPP